MFCRVYFFSSEIIGWRGYFKVSARLGDPIKKENKIESGEMLSFLLKSYNMGMLIGNLPKICCFLITWNIVYFRYYYQYYFTSFGKLVTSYSKKKWYMFEYFSLSDESISRCKSTVDLFLPLSGVPYDPIISDTGFYWMRDTK